MAERSGKKPARPQPVVADMPPPSSEERTQMYVTGQTPAVAPNSSDRTQMFNHTPGLGSPSYAAPAVPAAQSGSYQPPHRAISAPDGMPVMSNSRPGSQPPQNWSQPPPPYSGHSQDPRFMTGPPPPMASPAQSFRPPASMPPPSMVGTGGPPPVLLQGKPDARLVLITDPDSARAVSFRLLRDNLLARRLPRVLAVSSSAPNEGKTICALNLALSLSEGAKVLLLEGNLSDPELAKIFCIPEATPLWPPNAPWLAPYRIVEFSRTLHVAGIVTRPGQLPHRFDKQWWEMLIGSLRRFPYDFIIIDVAALSESPTVIQMVASADSTLLAVRSGVTTARSLRRATDQIPDGKAMGVALIDANVRR